MSYLVEQRSITIEKNLNQSKLGRAAITSPASSCLTSRWRIKNRKLPLYYSRSIVLPISLFTLCLITIIPNQSESASTELTFELPDNAKQCFHEDLVAGTKATLEFQVVFGGYYDVDMTLYDARQSVLYQGVKKQFDTHQWTAAMSGQYTFCFSNEFSTFSHKLIYFELISGEEEQLPNVDHSAATAMTKFEAVAENIHENLNSIFDAQTHYKLSEAKGGKRAEDLNSRVFWWSAFETMAVVFIGVVQVWTLKSFFSGHRYTRLQT